MTKQIARADLVAHGAAEPLDQARKLAATLQAGAKRARADGLHRTAEYLLGMLRSMHASAPGELEAATPARPAFLPPRVAHQRPSGAGASWL